MKELINIKPALRLFPECYYPDYTNPKFSIILFLLPLSLGSRIHGLLWTDTGQDYCNRETCIRDKDMDPFKTYQDKQIGHIVDICYKLRRLDMLCVLDSLSSSFYSCLIRPCVK